MKMEPELHQLATCYWLGDLGPEDLTRLFRELFYNSDFTKHFSKKAG